MLEQQPRPLVTREMVTRSYKKFVERGMRNPNELDLNDPEVILAQGLEDLWSSQFKDKNLDFIEIEDSIRYSFLHSTIYTDAGFDDLDYLDMVANDWLAQDHEEALELGLDDLAAEILAKIEQLNNQLESSNN